MKKNLQNWLLIAVTLIISPAISNAQWTQVGQVYGGTIANDGAVSFTIDNKGYVVAGSSTGDVYVFDTLANAFTFFTTAPTQMGHAFAMSFVVDGKAYIIGGDTSGYTTPGVWEFDPSNMSNHWTQKNNFGGGNRDAGFGFSINNVGYAGSGFDGANMYNDIWKYDATHDSWTNVGNLPVNGLIFPTSFVAGNKGYVLTGGTSPSGVNEIKKMWSIDGYTDSIAACSDYPGHGRQAAFAVSNNSFAFVGGGQTNYTDNYYDMFMYEVATDHWYPSLATPMLGTAWASSFVIGNTGYAGLGAKFVAAGLTGNDIFYKIDMDIATGVQNASASENHLNVYPNPSAHEISISGINSSAKMIITDALGKTVKMIEHYEVNKSIFIGDLSNGIYSIQLIENNKISVNKFIKD